VSEMTVTVRTLQGIGEREIEEMCLQAFPKKNVNVMFCGRAFQSREAPTRKS